MKRIKLNTWSLGNQFDKVAEKAKEISIEKDNPVEFEFNEIICIVDKNTNLALLWKDYSNSHLMDWKLVDGNMVYNDEVKGEISKRNKNQEDKHNAYMQEQKIKDDKEKDFFESQVKGVEIQLKDEKEWNNVKEINSDPYGKCAVDYAEGWARLMQVQIAHGKNLKDIAELTSYQLSFYGITGFMYGAAVSMLSKCWIHGEELRKWHNKEYKHEGEGVVNPAILTLSA